MATPPSYEESASQHGLSSSSFEIDAKEGDSKAPQHFSIREEVGTSRSQHVAALIARLLPQIRERAKQGLSKSTLLLLPSDQANCTSRGELVGYSQDDRPILIQLEGRYDGTQFWTQQEALDLLREQMLQALLGDQPVKEEPLPERPPEMPPVPARTSFFGRKASKAPAPPPPPPPVPPPVTVHVDLDQVNFRSETEYGLFETIRGRAVLMVVDIR